MACAGVCPRPAAGSRTSAESRSQLAWHLLRIPFDSADPGLVNKLSPDAIADRSGNWIGIANKCRAGIDHKKATFGKGGVRQICPRSGNDLVVVSSLNIEKSQSPKRDRLISRFSRKNIVAKV